MIGWRLKAMVSRTKPMSLVLALIPYI